MCLPLPCCSQGRPGQFAKALGANAEEQQGITDFCEDLIKSLGCAQRTAQGKVTLFGIAHKNILNSIKTTFPNSNNQCTAEAVQGIINGIAATIPSCQQGQQVFIQELLRNVAPHVGKLLQCIFGPERAVALELNLHRSLYPLAIDWLGCLLPILIQLCQASTGSSLCGQSPGNSTPCQPPTGGGHGPPIFGPNAPPHEPVMTRGGTDPINTGGTYSGTGLDNSITGGTV